MKNTKESIIAALNLLSTIPVKGAAVKPMAMAMQHLENTLEDLNRMEKDAKEADDGR